MSAVTPIMQQYADIKKTLDEKTLLTFKLGDYYEFFDEDALAAAPILKLPVLNRKGHDMVGFADHQSGDMWALLVDAGYAVAIAQIKPAPEIYNLTKILRCPI